MAENKNEVKKNEEPQSDLSASLVSNVEIDEAMEKEIEAKTREKIIEQAVAMRMAQNAGVNVVDTNNPYGLLVGQRPTYVVGNKTLTPNGLVASGDSSDAGKGIPANAESVKLSEMLNTGE